MRYTCRAVPTIAFLVIAACRGQPPRPANEFGVHVAAAGNAAARVRFTVTIKGSLEIDIHSGIVAIRPDSSLLLATPADLLVKQGAGSAVITAADSGRALVVTRLDSTDAAPARGHAVRVERTGDSRHLTVTTVPQSPEVRQ